MEMLLSSIPASLPSPDRDYCLFLDFDGTLMNLEAGPDDVQRDEALVRLLGETTRRLAGAVAIVSGRRIDAVDALIAPLRMPVAGVHGYERRAADGVVYRPTPDLGRLAVLRERLDAFAGRHPGLLLEDKGAALAVHYRKVPYLGAQVLEYLSGMKPHFGDQFELLEGSEVVEIKPAVHNKATAVEAYMQEFPFAGRSPIYIGDDTTDCDGFMAVERHQGMAIAVGSRVATPFRLRDPAAVRAWLEDFNHMSVRNTER
jgi:trehalose 6-phosphate phosphatase